MVRTNETAPALIGRRSGVLVALDRNELGIDGMENLEGFFAATLSQKEQKARFDIVKKRDAVSTSLLASVQTWWDDSSPPGAADLSSVSTAPADENESYYGNITNSVESEIEASSYQDNDANQSTTPRSGAQNRSPMLGGVETSLHSPNSTEDDPMVGMIVTDGPDNQEGSFLGEEGELDQSLISNLMIPEEAVSNFLSGSDAKALQDRHSNAEDVSSMTESISSSKVDERTPNDDSTVGEALRAIDSPSQASTAKGSVPTQESQVGLAGSPTEDARSKSLSADIRQRKQQRARLIESARFETHSAGTGNESDREPLFYDDESPVCPPSPVAGRRKSNVQRKRPSTKSGPPSRQKTTKKKKSDKKKKPNPYATVFASEGIPQPRSYNIIPMSDLKPGPPEDGHLRRSRRAQVAPLKHWCGERLVYGPNDFGDDYEGVRNMSVVTGIAFANPTQYKKRAARQMNGTEACKMQRISEDEGEFDLAKLRMQFRVSDGCMANLWQCEDIVETRCIAYFNELEFHKQPPTVVSSQSRPKPKRQAKPLSAKGISSSCLDEIYPGFLMGSLRLPKGSLKEGETVGESQHTFTVVGCQPSSLVLSIEHPNIDGSSSEWDPYTANHFVLNKGDNFMISAGNRYRLQNHSKHKECVVSVTVLYKPDLVHDLDEIADDDRQDVN